MQTAQLRLPLLREVVVPLLCAIIALWGIAQARSEGVRIADPAHQIAFMLCTAQSETGDSGVPANHDCGDCCLTSPLSSARDRIALVLRQHQIVTMMPRIRTVTPRGSTTFVPLSRGPPALA